ncbi:protein vip1-like isoform X2 [Typha angustifolia]|uniref:protein vip1-like isoform X2 n=1 Tax=Typha angustifolia TaxID=59011 RepID=UPI003C2FA362
MGTLDLTVQVTNISPKTTKTDLLIFFSYCGTVDEIQLQREGDQSQLATVTFSQPYALKTALLLNGASIGDRRVRVLPLENITDIPVESSESEFDNMSTKLSNRVIGRQVTVQPVHLTIWRKHHQ